MIRDLVNPSTVKSRHVFDFILDLNKVVFSCYCIFIIVTPSLYLLLPSLDRDKRCTSRQVASQTNHLPCV